MLVKLAVGGAVGAAAALIGGILLLDWWVRRGTRETPRES
jgi:hypothetical protein